DVCSSDLVFKRRRNLGGDLPKILLQRLQRLASRAGTNADLVEGVVKLFSSRHQSAGGCGERRRHADGKLLADISHLLASRLEFISGLLETFAEGLHSRLHVT